MTMVEAIPAPRGKTCCAQDTIAGAVSPQYQDYKVLHVISRTRQDDIPHVEDRINDRPIRPLIRSSEGGAAKQHRLNQN